MDIIYEIPKYTIYWVREQEQKGFNIPYIMCVPKYPKQGDCIIVETNNEERHEYIKKSAIEETLAKLIIILNGSNNNNPVVIPILPSIGKNNPYFQQLAKECFDENLSGMFYRLDEQIVSLIEDAKTNIEQITNTNLDKRIFLNGYSSSGVFAQRFALLHPELIKEVCIGGAIGSMPLPIYSYKGNELKYPVGIADYEEIMGKKFNMQAYKDIKFRYYYAEFEREKKALNRFNEYGENAPMHDMSYMIRSTPSETGNNLRKSFGIDMIERFSNQLTVVEQLGIQMHVHEPYAGVDHSHIGSYPFKYIDDCLTECNRTQTTVKEKH